ncbi:4733_t:CDS:2 [Acaulospora colombiana]|uniref:4733_t:CDS:1 n=1 Tax=Acaulospora colombiana TaxID=27376 RepID=A0ACA9MKI8_9GLOM|nr:4733_t:CDS:2 [Acaulospora colombiana]
MKLQQNRRRSLKSAEMLDNIPFSPLFVARKSRFSTLFELLDIPPVSWVYKFGGGEEFYYGLRDVSFERRNENRDDWGMSNESRVVDGDNQPRLTTHYRCVSLQEDTSSFNDTFDTDLLVGFAVPTWMPDEYPPDLITVVNPHSSGGQYYLKSSADQGLEGDCRVERNLYWPTYSNNHDSFAPNFFIRGGDLYSMTNETHILQVVALNFTDHNTDHYQPSSGNPPSAHAITHDIISGPTTRYKLQLVDPKKAIANTGVGEGFERHVVLYV